MDDEFVVSTLDVTRHSTYPIVRIRFFNKVGIERAVVLPLDGVTSFVNLLAQKCDLKPSHFTPSNENF